MLLTSMFSIVRFCSVESQRTRTMKITASRHSSIEMPIITDRSSPSHVLLVTNHRSRNSFSCAHATDPSVGMARPVSSPPLTCSSSMPDLTYVMMVKNPRKNIPSITRWPHSSD